MIFNNRKQSPQNVRKYARIYIYALADVRTLCRKGARFGRFRTFSDFRTFTLQAYESKSI